MIKGYLVPRDFPWIENYKLLFVAVTAEKLVGGLFPGGTEFIQNFHKGEIYLIGEISSGKSFRWGKFLSPG